MPLLGSYLFPLVQAALSQQYLQGGECWGVLWVLGMVLRETSTLVDLNHV